MLFEIVTASVRRWALILWICVPSIAFGDINLEKNLQAAIVYQFTNFVKWPNKQSEKVVIAVADDVVFFEAIKTLLKNKNVDETQVEVQNVELEKIKSESKKYHILVFEKGESKAIRGLLESFKTMPLLTVTFGEGLTAAGSMVNFFEENDHIRFEINMPLADAVGLKVDAQLLRLSRTPGKGGN